MANSKRLIVHGGTLIDGTGAAPIDNATIVIANGKVERVDTGLQPPDGEAEVVDARGKYVLPGLWDTHTHFYDWMGELYLNHGVTTIIDVGNYIDWILAQRDGVRKGMIRAPRILCCGHALGGDPVFAAQKHMSLILSGADAARSVAQWQVDKGVDGIKVWVFTKKEEVGPAAEVARAHNLPVIGHLSVSAADAVRSGLNVLSHATGLPPATVKDPKLSDWLVEAERRRMRAIYTHEEAPTAAYMHSLMEEDTFDSVIDLFLHNGVYIEPDLVFKWMFAMEDRCGCYESEDYTVINSPGLEYVPNWAHRRLAMAWNVRKRMTEAQLDEVKRAFEKMCSFLSRFAERGGRLLIGSDTTTWPLPGRSLVREMSILMDTVGISAMQAIQGATKYGAESMRQAERLGTVSPGKEADLVIVDGNPLERIESLNQVVQVIQFGKVISTNYHPDYANPLPKPHIGLTHSYPIPRIEGGEPPVATQGDTELHLTLRGSGFVKQSVIHFDGVPVPTHSARWDQIEGRVPGYLLGRPGTFPVWVQNPEPIRTTDYLHNDQRSNVFEVVVRFA